MFSKDEFLRLPAVTTEELFVSTSEALGIVTRRERGLLFNCARHYAAIRLARFNPVLVLATMGYYAKNIGVAFDTIQLVASNDAIEWSNLLRNTDKPASYSLPFVRVKAWSTQASEKNVLKHLQASMDSNILPEWYYRCLIAGTAPVSYDGRHALMLFTRAERKATQAVCERMAHLTMDNLFDEEA